MKVVCDSCQAKYQVPDARVAGKKLKIRCKRCGATVLIRGDAIDAVTTLDEGATQVAPSSITGGFASAGTEWNVSVDGQVSGPFVMPELLSWLATSDAGWDAYVWREGFPDWVPARACDEIVTAAGGAPNHAVAATGTEDEHPTRMFQGPGSLSPTSREIPPPNALSSSAGVSRASIAPASSPFSASARPSQPPRVQSSVGSIPPVRASQPPRVPASAVVRSPSRAPSSASQPPRTASMPPRTASMPPRAAPASMPPRAASNPQLMAAAQRGAAPQGPDDSILFSTQNLYQVAQTGSQPPGQLRPGYAGGDGSGLVDIRALAEMARQQKSIPPRGPARAVPSDDGRFSYGDDTRGLALDPSGSFARIDSLAPVTPRPGPHKSNALPLAVFGGFALLAAAAFAAIVITRSPAASASQPSAAPAHAAVAAAAQPMAAPPLAAAPVEAPAPEPAKTEVAPSEPAANAATPSEAAAVEPAAVEPEKTEAAAEPEREATKVAESKPSKRHGRSARTASDEKPRKPEVEEKKAKEKEKAAPPSLDDVMLAEKSEPKEAPKVEEKIEKPAEPEAKGDSAIDDLLSGSPAPAKSRSIDDLLDGAVADAKKPKAAKADAAPSAEALPESPSRDQVLSAMRGIESQVRACASGITGTALVQLEVDGSNGRVSSSNATGIDDPAASCIAKAARGAKFPRFSKPSFSVKYPYRLK